MIIVNKQFNELKIQQEENKPFTTQTFIYILNYRFALLEVFKMSNYDYVVWFASSTRCLFFLSPYARRWINDQLGV